MRCLEEAVLCTPLDAVPSEAMTLTLVSCILQSLTLPLRHLESVPGKSSCFRKCELMLVTAICALLLLLKAGNCAATSCSGHAESGG